MDFPSLHPSNTAMLRQALTAHPDEAGTPVVRQALRLLQRTTTEPPSINRIDEIALTLEQLRLLQPELSDHQDPRIENPPEIDRYFKATGRMDTPQLERELATVHAVAQPNGSGKIRRSILHFRLSQRTAGSVAHDHIQTALRTMPVLKYRAFYHMHAARINDGDTRLHLEIAHALTQEPNMKALIAEKIAKFSETQATERMPAEPLESVATTASNAATPADPALSAVLTDACRSSSPQSSLIGTTDSGLSASTAPHSLADDDGTSEYSATSGYSGRAGSLSQASTFASFETDPVAYERVDRMRRGDIRINRAVRNPEAAVRHLKIARRHGEAAQGENITSYTSLRLAQLGELPVQNAHRAIIDDPDVNYSRLAAADLTRRGFQRQIPPHVAATVSPARPNTPVSDNSAQIFPAFLQFPPDENLRTRLRALVLASAPATQTGHGDGTVNE